MRSEEVRKKEREDQRKECEYEVQVSIPSSCTFLWLCSIGIMKK